MWPIDAIKSGVRALAGTMPMQRSIGLTSLSDANFWKSIGNSNFGGGTMTGAGTYVGPMTGLRVSANLACIRFISKMQAAVPCHVYKLRNKKNPQGGKDIADQHPLDQVLALSPCSDMTAFTWQIREVHNRAVFGTSYNTIDFNGRGQCIALWPSIGYFLSIAYFLSTCQSKSDTFYPCD